jgi:two-component sensor histidine kinase
MYNIIKMITVFFIYGLSFFILGFSILLYPKKSSSYVLAENIWLIAAFGILHGINEWIDMFILIRGHEDMIPLKIIRMFIAPFSFLFLVVFGTRGIIENNEKYSALKLLPPVLFIIWSCAVAVSSERFLAADIWGRYLLGAPGIFLSAFALILQKPAYKNLPIVTKDMNIVIAALFFYGVFSGLIVPKADFFPASFLNYPSFAGLFGIPVQILRTVCALAMTYGIVRVLGVFEMETKEALRKSRDELEHKVDERTAELVNINKELESEISQRIQVEKQIRVSLREKEVLLREIHHRVKNNMAIISSLLQLQARYSKDENLNLIFRESQDRISSMALVHEKLYQTKDFINIKFKGYVEEIVGHLLQTHGRKEGDIDLVLSTGDIKLNIDTMIPCGLIINELVTNSLKHAFDDVESPEISISLNVDNNQASLVYSDNGRGIPEHIDFQNSGTLGLQLVNMLAFQLKGTVKLERDGGTKFTIKFKIAS